MSQSWDFSCPSRNRPESFSFLAMSAPAATMRGMGTTAALATLRGRTTTRLYPWDRVRLAVRALDGHPHGTTPRTVASALGIRLLVGRTSGCGGECVSGDDVVIGHHRDARTQALLAWHGIAHVLLRREAWEHDEGDVWMLTFELACPKAVVDGDLDELVATTWAPEVVVRAWVPIARTLGQGAS